VLAIAFALANAYVGYLFVKEGMTDKLAAKGFMLQSLPLLGGIALIVFCLPVLWTAFRLMTSKPASY
jgi:hypothetical protein